MARRCRWPPDRLLPPSCRAQTRRLLVALSRHPNAAGVLFLSLGFENCTHQQVLDELGDFDHERVRFLTCQDVADEQIEGHKILAEIIVIL